MHRGAAQAIVAGMLRVAGAACAAVLLAGCFDHGPETQARTTRMGKLFGGEDHLAIVRDPDRVDAFKLRQPSRADEGGSYNQWPVVGKPVRVPADLAARFSRGLTSEGTYRGDNPKACKPIPGFMLRFTGDGRGIDVTLCFECAILFTHRGPVALGYANFDDSVQPIASLLLQVFPGDPDLRKVVQQ